MFVSGAKRFNSNLFCSIALDGEEMGVRRCRGKREEGREKRMGGVEGS